MLDKFTDGKLYDIDYAIPETTRPPIYTCMKYWGKKPHNVWSEYIKTYVPKNGVYLDPFCGSGMSGIEAIRLGKKAICLDINPITSFIFDVYCSNFVRNNFEQIALHIVHQVLDSKIYNKFFLYEDGYILHNTKYENGRPYEVCFISKDKKNRFERIPTRLDIDINNESKDINITTLYPNKNFRKSSAFSNSFLNTIGTSYDCLYTKKNLSILSLIFEEILQVNNINLKLQLLFAFIQTVHLCCKMCVPRSKKTRRDYSTSWGRSAYFSSSKSMEMNPLLVFYNNCVGKQSVTSCLSYLQTYVGKIKGKNITKETNINLNEDYNLWYGIKDSKQLANIIENNVVDFVLTDPPYGGLVPYLDLSYIWLAWLELYDKIYNPDYSNEISIGNDKSSQDFRHDMAEVLRQIFKVSKVNAKIVLTFNNKEPLVWKALLGSIVDSGYMVEKVIHQQNLRSGESNVSDKYGTSSSDFYIRCVKNLNLNFKDGELDLHNYICQVAEDIILSRNEPTPYQILFNGIIAKLSCDPLAFQNFDDDLVVALQHSDRFYTINNLDTTAGNYWWLKNKPYDPNSSNTLTNRIRGLLKEIFDSVGIISQTRLLGIIYKKFPNGLSPDRMMLEKLILEYAQKKGVSWIRK